MKHLFFDLDGFMIETDKLMPYRSSHLGRRYVAENPSKVDTKEITVVKNIVKKLAHSKTERIYVLTNSPKEYACALLKKHKFPTMEIIASADKPSTIKIKEFLKTYNIKKNDAIILGDAATDILCAHELQVVSIGIPGYSNITQLAEAEPTRISTHHRLEADISDFINNRLEYSPRTALVHAKFLTNPSIKNIEMKIENLYNYYPVNNDNFYYSHSKELLDFKSAKDYTKEEINAKIRIEYFNGRTISKKRTYYELINKFARAVIEKINALKLTGTTTILGAPNSCPEYCYKMDINRVFANHVIRLHELEKNENSGIHRIIPTPATHLTNNRSKEKHYKSITTSTIPQTNNIIIIDDIVTSGAQLEAVGKIIRELGGYQGNIYGIALGKTVND